VVWASMPTDATVLPSILRHSEIWAQMKQCKKFGCFCYFLAEEKLYLFNPLFLLKKWKLLWCKAETSHSTNKSVEKRVDFTEKIARGILREYRMVYRGPGFLAVVWFGSSLPCSSRDTQEVWERKTTCWRKRWEEVGEEPNHTARNEVRCNSIQDVEGFLRLTYI
jgi:hypothetical protein